MARSRAVLVTGASGLIGGALVRSLRARGAPVHTLSRHVPPGASGESGGVRQFEWDVAKGTIDPAAFEGVDAVVHLAGESIAEGRWTPQRKEAIRESRVKGTALIAEAMAAAPVRPRVLVSGSAVGWYGNCEEAIVTEESSAGTGFLAEVCAAWEAATLPAERAEIRTVHLRTGMVVSAAGGALAKMLGPFRLGLGGPIGSGRQWISWIHIDDHVAIMHRLLDDDDISGPINAVSPTAVRQREFATMLGLALGRPALLPMPALAVKLLFGEMGERLLLEGAKVLPARLKGRGFEWSHPTLASALGAELRRKG